MKIIKIEKQEDGKNYVLYSRGKNQYQVFVTDDGLKALKKISGIKESTNE